MDNYNLKAIKERNEQVFLETSFYELPVYASVESIKTELQNSLNESSEEILKSRKIELNWVNEKNNLTVLRKLLSNDESVLFLPERYRRQVINAQRRQQPCYFFIEKGIRQNFRGSWELRLRQSCEVEPHKKGYKKGYNLSIIVGAAVHVILVDGRLNILDIIEHDNKLLPNMVF